MKLTQKTFLIYGVSKGLGKAIFNQLPDAEDKVFGISRTRPDFLNTQNDRHFWIQADLSDVKNAKEAIQHAIGGEQIDYLIYNVGIWEKTAFNADYDFEQLAVDEIEEIIHTNITSLILSVQSFLPNLRKSENAKIIFIGSTLGLENHNKQAVIFSAAKFALRGVVQSLRTHLRKDNIGITALNLGDLATDAEHDETLIPLSDVISALNFVIQTSNASCVKEIDMPSMKDIDL
ncbi:SDR family NAD(P)-dependent oxidoreductase [Pedobacter steynii]|uniref:Short-chain dehydrogenase n=1 Tax=Pedobacter steynii TaxID=430522 RepID=A0A1D7QIH8_9SPHI|nr:SDR family oxidoreductase [Pedobacter steynii]AOM78453.1 short-chain dehydrogenase [Pedobacter steynii]